MILGRDLLGKEPAWKECVCVGVGGAGRGGAQGDKPGKGRTQGVLTLGDWCGCSDRAQ